MKQNRSKPIHSTVWLGAVLASLLVLLFGSALGAERSLVRELAAPVSDAQFFVLPYPSIDPSLEVAPLAGLQRSQRGRGQPARDGRPAETRPSLFRIPLPDGPFVILATAPGFVDLRGPFHPEARLPESRLSFGGNQLEHYQGRLLDADGEAMAGADVTLHAVANILFSGDSRNDFRVSTASDGSFSLPYLPGLPWMMEIIADGYPVMTRMGNAGLEAIRLPALARFEGRTVDRQGGPVAQAAVRLFGRDRDFAWTSYGETNQLGEFRLAVWPSPQSAVRLTLAAEGLARVDRSLSGGETLFELEAGNRLLGRLAGAETALVRLKRLSSGDPRPWEEVGERQTGAGFSFGALPSGTYRLEIRSRSFGLRTLGPFELANGENRELGLIRASPGMTIAGRVADEEGNPVPGARVSILAGDYYTVPQRFFPQVTTSQEGSFSLAGIEPGDYTAEVFHPEFSWSFEALDESAADLQVRLSRGGARIDGTASRPAWGQEQIIALAFPRSSRKILWAVPDASGRFHYHHLPVDDYTLDRMALPPEHRTVDLRETSKVAFGPAEGLRVKGRVMLGDRPLANAAVRLEPDQEGVYVIRALQPPMSNEAGRFEVQVDRVGVYTPHLAVGDFLLSAAQLEIVPGQEFEIRLPATRLTGRVVDSQSGRPVAGARFAGLTFGAPQLGGAFKGRTDQEGRFTILGVAPGTCQIRFAAQGYLDPTDLTVELLDDRPAQVEVELVAGPQSR